MHYRVFKLSEILDLLEAQQLITMDMVQQAKQFLAANQTVTPPKPLSVKGIILYVILMLFVFRQELILIVMVLLLILLLKSCFI